jgi:S1-C subfamily serine protease
VDDLEGASTSLSRLVAGTRSWLAILLAIGLIVPAGAWLVDEYVFQRSADAVIATLDGERSGAAAAETVLLVRTVGCAGTSSTGSAFVVETAGGPALVTNRHVVEDARTVGVRGLEGASDVRVTEVRLSDTADVAVLTVADPDALPPALELGRGVPTVDTSIRIVGFPAGTPFTDAGRVAEVGGAQLLLEVEVSPGASGSPVVADDGRVVGQVFATSGDGRGVATPADALRAAIGDARPSEPC